MSTWIKAVPPKMLHDKFGTYNGQWMPEMDRSWIRVEDGVSVSSRLLKTPWGNVEHVTISRFVEPGSITFDGSGDLSWSEKYAIKNELFGENRVAIEIFPTTDRLVDVCDVYHLWVFDKKFKMPFGIHPKEYQKAINRGYSMTKDELETLQNYYNSTKKDGE